LRTSLFVASRVSFNFTTPFFSFLVFFSSSGDRTVENVVSAIEAKRSLLADLLTIINVESSMTSDSDNDYSSSRGFDEIYTHSIYGDYGHIQHQVLSRVVTMHLRQRLLLRNNDNENINNCNSMEEGRRRRPVFFTFNPAMQRALASNPSSSSTSSHACDILPSFHYAMLSSFASKESSITHSEFAANIREFWCQYSASAYSAPAVEFTVSLTTAFALPSAAPCLASLPPLFDLSEQHCHLLRIDATKEGAFLSLSFSIDISIFFGFSLCTLFLFQTHFPHSL
jgi:hypothetical protein